MSLAQLWRDFVMDATTFGRSVGRRNYLARYMRKSRRYSIAEFPDGKYGRVVGHAHARGEPLLAPISGLPCVFYIVRVVDPLTRDPKTGDPTVVARGVSPTAFFIEDRSGRALIDPAGAMGFLGEPSASDTCHRAPSAIVWLVHEQKRTIQSHFTYAEWLISEGEPISVLGGGSREPDPDAPPAPEYRGEPAMRLRIAQTEPYALMISDSAATMK